MGRSRRESSHGAQRASPGRGALEATRPTDQSGLDAQRFTLNRSPGAKLTPMRIGSGICALALAATMVAVGCTSDVHPPFRDDGLPTADTGYILPTTTGGDAAGTYNLPLKHEHAEHVTDEHAPPNYGGGTADTPAVDRQPNESPASNPVPGEVQRNTTTQTSPATRATPGQTTASTGTRKPGTIFSPARNLRPRRNRGTRAPSPGVTTPTRTVTTPATGTQPPR